MLRQPVCKSRQRCADSITAEFQTYSRINISIKTVGREPHVINFYGLTAPVMRMQVSTFIHIVYVEAQTTFHPFILFHLFLSANLEPILATIGPDYTLDKEVTILIFFFSPAVWIRGVHGILLSTRKGRFSCVWI